MPPDATPTGPLPYDQVEVQRRQRVRARIMGVMLIALAALIFAVTIVKTKTPERPATAPAAMPAP
jgi:hypothetical protein